MSRHAGVVVAGAAGACIVSALSGASSALTVIPAWATALTGLLLASSALRSSRNRTRESLALACGVAVGLALPTKSLPAPGVVAAHGVATGMRGDLFDALDRLDADPTSLVGDRISVSGIWMPANGDRLATISRRVMSCCAADEVDVGFDVSLSRATRLRPGEWIRIDGIVGERVVDGDVRYLLEHSVARGLEDTVKSAH